MANGKPNDAESVKRQGAFAGKIESLSGRERAMILILIIVGLGCAFYFLLLNPSLNKINALTTEASEAEERQNEYMSVISQGIGADEQIAEAIAAYDEIKQQFFAPMMTETLDSTATGYLVKAGFDPQDMSVSPIELEELTPFVSSSSGSLPGSENSAEENAPAAEAEAPSEGEAPAEGEDAQMAGAIYSYTVSATADGGWSNLYKLIDRINTLGGVEMMQYSFSAGDTNEDEKSKGSFSMTIKFYVFAEEAPAPDEATPAPDEATTA